MKGHLKQISSNTTQHQTDGPNLCSHTWKLKFDLIISTQVLEIINCTWASLVPQKSQKTSALQVFLGTSLFISFNY